MMYRVGQSEDGQSAFLEMHQDGKPDTTQHMLFSASELEWLIHRLAKVRSALPEAVAPALDPGSRLDPEMNPTWSVVDAQQHSGPPGIVLAIRHSGLGWLGFHLPKDAAKALRGALTKSTRR